MKRLIAGAAFGIVAGFAAAGDPPDAPPPHQQLAMVKALVEQLGAESYTDRVEASRSLEKLGRAAIPALEAAKRSDNPEVRLRAAAIAIRVDRSSESSMRLTPRCVALDYHDLPLGTAVNDLRARTGLHIVLDGTRVANPLRKITCRTGQLPVWEAVEAFCRDAELRELFTTDLELPKQTIRRRGEFIPLPDPRADSVAIVLMDGKPDRLPGSRSTAVRVIALPPRFAGHKASLGTGEYSLCFDVAPSPGLNWQDVVGVKVSRVMDSSGRAGAGGVEKSPLPFFDPTGRMIFARPGVAFRYDQNGYPIMPETIPNPRVVRVPIQVATATARSLKRLEGIVYGEVSLLNQPLVTITNLKASSGKAFEGLGDLKVTLLETREAPRGGQGFVRIQFEYPSPWLVNARKRGVNPAFNPGWPEAPQSPAMSRALKAFDAAGKPFPVTTSGHTDFSDDGMMNIETIQFTFRGEAGLPAKLVVTGPRSLHVEVPFVMENVQLP
jgi:hypothetical protein